MIIIKAKLRNISKMEKVWRVVFHIITADISEDISLQLLQAIKTDGWLTFSPDKLKTEIEAVMKNRKIGINELGNSKSEILRGRLFTLWKNSYHEGIEFEKYYEGKMDTYITGIQQIIDKIEIDRLDDFYYKVKDEPR